MSAGGAEADEKNTVELLRLVGKSRTISLTYLKLGVKFIFSQ